MLPHYRKRNTPHQHLSSAFSHLRHMYFLLPTLLKTCSHSILLTVVIWSINSSTSDNVQLEWIRVKTPAKKLISKHDCFCWSRRLGGQCVFVFTCCQVCLDLSLQFVIDFELHLTIVKPVPNHRSAHALWVGASHIRQEHEEPASSHRRSLAPPGRQAVPRFPPLIRRYFLGRRHWRLRRFPQMFAALERRQLARRPSAKPVRS